MVAGAAGARPREQHGRCMLWEARLGVLSNKERKSRGETVCVVAVAASNGCECAVHSRAACQAEYERSCQWVAMDGVHNRRAKVLLQGTQRGSAYNEVNLGAFVESVFLQRSS